MQVTELFTSQLEEAIRKNPHGNLSDFLPDIHDSLPEIQENLLYICAAGRRTLHQMQQYSFNELDGYMFLFTHSGQGIIEVAGDSRNLQSGDLLFWDCQDFIQMRALSDDWDVDMLFFNGAAVTTYYEEICKITFPLFHIPENSLPECRFTEIMALGPVITPHHAFMTHKLLTNLLSDLITGLHISDDNTVKAVPSYIEELKNLFVSHCEADYSMDELAVRFNVNRYRMTREFAHFVGMTPLKFLNNVRIEKARALIESTDLSIGAVGTAVGIPNSTHFINLFKDKLGMTPQVYRDGYRSFREISKSY